MTGRPMRLRRLIDGIEATGVTGDPDPEVRSLCYDSRQCEPGGLFVAIPGHAADGHRFIGDALARGARVVVHEREFLPPPSVTAVRVADSRRALGRLGRNFYGDPSAGLCLIAVVGTNGKTTITYLLESILTQAGHPTGVLGTVNYRYAGRSFPAPHTTPESVEMQRILREMADHGITHCVTEVSSHALALRRVDDCAFDAGIFTNLSQDHLDYHGTMENYFAAKRRFFTEVLPSGGKRRPRPMIVNGDDPYGRRIVEIAPAECITYGLDERCDLRPDPFRLSLDGIEATLRMPDGPLAVRCPLSGRFNLYNLLAAAAAACTLGVPREAIQSGLARLPQVPGRLEKVSAAGQPAVFVDYAHTEDALTRVLQNLSLFRTERIITVFGCGGDRDRGKRPLMGRAASATSDLTIVTSDNPRTEDPHGIIREIEAGIPAPKLSDPDESRQDPARKGYLVIPDRREAIITAIGLAGPSDIVFIAGKGHEDYQIVGRTRHPFDDREVAREALRRLHGKDTGS